MAIIIPANSAADTGYSIDNSCRFNRADSAKFERTISSDGSLTAWTFNVWLKRGEMTAANLYSLVWNRDSSGTAAITSLEFYGTATAANQQVIYFYNYDNPGDGEKAQKTTRKFRDPSAWYNLHVMWDSNNATAGNRMRIFINGVEETDFTLDQNPGSGAEGGLLRGSVATKLSIGFHPYNNSNYYDGYMANAILCDGQAYLPTKFGEFDEDSPTIWKPIDPSEQSLSFGTHGFWLDFADSSDLGNDVSGQNNDFTPANFAATDQATDTPTNNFCTMNPLDNYYMQGTFSEGNCKVATTSAQWGYNTGTMGVAKGKWYWEMHMTDPVDTTNYVATGIAGRVDYDADDGLAYREDAIAYQGNDGKIRNNGTLSTYGDSYTTNDIISIAVDLDNNKIYFAENGTWKNSGDPAGNSNGHSISAASTTQIGHYLPAFGDHAGSSWTNATVSFNFGGCPSFTISSGNADGDGYGNFEYAVPSGFYSLCSKNLAKYG